MIDVVPNAGVIALGKQGENQAVRVTLPNIRAGSGSILLLHQRAADQQPYPVPVVEADGGIIWTVSSTDTAYPGRGQAELQWLGADGAVIKSVTYQTNTLRALTAPGAVPDEPLKPYTQAVAKDAQAAKDAAASATEAARSAGAIVGQAGQSAQSAQAAALAAAQNAAAAETAEAGAKQAQTGAEAASTEAQTAKTAAEKAAQEAKTAQAGAMEAKTGAETAQAKAEEAAQGVAADREQIGANTSGLEAAKQDVTALKAETARTARSLDYLWKKSKGIIYDTETVTGAGSSVTVPSGAMDYAALRKLGGMSRKRYQALIDDFPESSTQINVAKRGRYSYVIETLNDGVYRQSSKSQNVNGATGQYTLHAVIVGSGGLIVRFHGEAGTKITEVEIGANNTLKTVNVPEDFAYINIVFLGNTGKSVPIGTRTEISNIMLEAGNAAHPWEPYTNSLLDAPVDDVRVANAAGDSTNTYPIPQTIRDLCPDYGQGTAESYNYIDFAAKAYYHVGSMDQNGTWTALATPEIIDLSAVWPGDDFGVLRVEAGGTINLHYPALDDGFELSVPSETEIMVDVAKVVETDG
nr:MAG TPA: hypothetical protein [Caudoviricetes sp.]